MPADSRKTGALLFQSSVHHTSRLYGFNLPAALHVIPFSTISKCSQHLSLFEGCFVDKSREEYRVFSLKNGALSGFGKGDGHKSGCRVLGLLSGISKLLPAFCILQSSPLSCPPPEESQGLQVKNSRLDSLSCRN